MVSIGPFEIPIPLRNLQGRMISGLMMPTISHVQIGVCKTEFLLSATQVVLALRAFQGTHGKLPDSLAELVPEYFPSIPRDPFDGEALRYSAEDKVVYSVGEDLEDAGGGEFEPDELTSIDENEPAVRISF